MSPVWPLLVAAAQAADASEPDRGTLSEEKGATSAVTTELLDDMLSRLAAERQAEGLRHLREGDLPQALAIFRDAHEGDPDDPDIAYNLGIVYRRLNDLEHAEQLFKLTLTLDPSRAGVYVDLADVLLAGSPEPVALDALWTGLARARRQNEGDVDIILRQARVAARRQRLEPAKRLYMQVWSQRSGDPRLAIEIGDLFRDFEREDDAIAWYRRVALDSDLVKDARQRIDRLKIDREARRFGWTARVEVPARARTLAARGKTLLMQQRLAEAEQALAQAVRIAPQYSEARRLFGDVLRAAARPDEAEVEYLRGLAFDQGSAELHARLGDLYLEQGDAARAAQATVLLSRVLQLRPDWSETHLSLARAYRATGDLPRALESVRRYLAGSPSPDGRRRADALYDALARALDETTVESPPPASDGPSSTKRELVARLNRARALLQRGETDAAMAELRGIAEERGADARKLEGRILHATGHLDEAAAAFRASLASDDLQADVHQQLGVVLAALGQLDAARQHLSRAEQLDDVDALYQRARLDLAAVGSGIGADVAGLPELLAARHRLARFLAESSQSIHAPDARILHGQISDRVQRLGGLGTLALFAAAAALLIWQRRVWGGADLQALLAAHPEAGPDVQRILSAIRHEVLKHNTMVLVGLVEAIEGGDDFEEKAAHLRRTLFEAPGEDAVTRRFDAYASALGQIGRAHGLRLNLRRRDAALSPIYRGFALLERLGRWIERLPAISDRRRQRLLAQLKRATALLTTEAYQGVQRLLQQLRLLAVDEEMLRAVFRRTSREPAFAGAQIAPLALAVNVDMPCAVAIGRGAFEDILGNLFRNAIQASRAGTDAPIAIGLSVTSEVNPVTGHERILFAVRDTSPQDLTTEQLWGQTIEGGLGLTAELVSKYEGSLAVEHDHAGWTKAVVVKLPREETAHAQ